MLEAGPALAVELDGQGGVSLGLEDDRLLAHPDLLSNAFYLIAPDEVRERQKGRRNRSLSDSPGSAEPPAPPASSQKDAAGDTPTLLAERPAIFDITKEGTHSWVLIPVSIALSRERSSRLRPRNASARFSTSNIMGLFQLKLYLSYQKPDISASDSVDRDLE